MYTLVLNISERLKMKRRVTCFYDPEEQQDSALLTRLYGRSAIFSSLLWPTCTLVMGTLIVAMVKLTQYLSILCEQISRIKRWAGLLWLRHSAWCLALQPCNGISERIEKKISNCCIPRRIGFSPLTGALASMDNAKRCNSTVWLQLWKGQMSKNAWEDKQFCSSLFLHLFNHLRAGQSDQQCVIWPSVYFDTRSGGVTSVCFCLWPSRTVSDGRSRNYTTPFGWRPSDRITKGQNSRVCCGVSITFVAQ